MLFVLDHDVDAAVGGVLRAAGHRCVPVGRAGLATASDDAVSVFADDHHAVLLTHDQEFIERRRKNTFGKHVLLACREWDAPEVVGAHLSKIMELVNTRDGVVMRVSKEGVTIYPSRWS